MLRPDPQLVAFVSLIIRRGGRPVTVQTAADELGLPILRVYRFKLLVSQWDRAFCFSRIRFGCRDNFLISPTSWCERQVERELEAGLSLEQVAGILIEAGESGNLSLRRLQKGRVRAGNRICRNYQISPFFRIYNAAFESGRPV